MLAILGRFWTLCWRSWAALGAAVCGPEPLFDPMLAVLGRSWGVRGRSWAALGAYVRDLGASVGGLGPLLGLMLAVLAALGAYVGGPWRPWAAKWSKPERESERVRGW